MPGYDHAVRRQGVRKAREKGVWLYVPAQELAKAGFSPFEPPPFYRVWGSRRGGLTARFYREQ
jgi:hypothetical protein